MEINNDILSGLKLMNSPVVELDDFKKILAECRYTLTPATKKETPQPKSQLPNAAKNGLNDNSLLRLLQDHLDTTSESYKIFSTFLTNILPKVDHNLNAARLDGNSMVKFRDLKWSQSLDIKSSILGNVREKNYIIDLHVDRMANSKCQRAGGSSNSTTTDDNTPGKDLNINSQQHREQEVISISLSQPELHDLYTSLVDCAKNVERIINK